MSLHIIILVVLNVMHYPCIFTALSVISAFPLMISFSPLAAMNFTAGDPPKSADTTN